VENLFHGTEDQLEQYALGRLPGSDLPLLEQHLTICAACRERLDRIEDFALGMREALPMTPAAPAQQPDWFGWLRRPALSIGLTFAALILAIGIFSNAGMKFAPSASLQLTAMRGEMPLTIPAREFDLTLSDGPREGGPFRVEVVNATGTRVWSGLAPDEHFKVQQRLGPGAYFVRLYSASGKMLREYGFRIRM
jgi:hypothetical protein